MTAISWIGIGRMGLPMASRLMAAGHEVRGVEPDPAAAARARDAGIDVRERASAAAGADVIFTMLPSAADVRSVLLGKDGLFRRLPAGTAVVDSSTIDVETARELHEKATEYGLRFLDAPVSGGVKGAEAGTLTFMAGGDSQTVADVTPILQPMAGRVVATGPGGTGQAAKIVNNMIMGVCMAATCEGVLLATRIGLDPGIFYDIATTATSDNYVLRKLYPAPGIVQDAPSSSGYAAGFMTRLLVKDLNLAIEAARNSGTPVSVTEKALEAFDRALGEGLDEHDCTSLYLSLTNAAGAVEHQPVVAARTGS